MPSYRLLRSNKESGPYTLNDLLTLGLKPYDLVWIEGRSAAWRYPSEVAELKPYAPVIEEQPYDRFYKKPSDIETPAKELVVEVPKRVSIPEPEFIQSYREAETETIVVKKVTPVISAPPPPPIQKKKVFVSLPETNGQKNEPDHSQEKRYEQYLPKSNPTPMQLPNEEKSYSPINIRESDESKLETKYTQSLDDIKDMYINTLVQRKTKNRRKEFARKYLKPALLPALLVLAGVTIGYFINSHQAKSGVPAQSASKTVPQATEPIANTETTPTLPVQDKQDTIGPSSSIKNTQPSIAPNTSNTTRVSQKKLIPVQEDHTIKTSTETVKQKEVAIPDRETAQVEKKNVEVDATTGERKSVVRDNSDMSLVDNSKKNNSEHLAKKTGSEHDFLADDHKTIRDMVSVKSNNYIRGAFGGIKGLELTVSNNSNYLVDEVSLEVQIMKPSEQPLRTDVITVKNISANGAVTIKVPDSQRGIRVDYKITSVESKQWQKGTAGL